jgi:hypothetical protein
MEDIRKIRINAIGQIRPGIKILTSAADQTDGVRAAWAEMVANGDDNDEIDAALRRRFKLQKSPLRPSNTEYLHVRTSSFPPGMAEALMDAYGDDRGEGRHLYELPVVIPPLSDAVILPWGLECHTASELTYWSEEREEGRMCCRRAQMGKRADGRFLRPFGGRPIEAWRACDPMECSEYQNRQCNERGTLYFQVPLWPGAWIEMPLSSGYGQMGISQFLAWRREGQHAPAILTKRREKISRIDPETGQPVRVEHWIPVLLPDVQGVERVAQSALPPPPAQPASPALDAPARASLEDAQKEMGRLRDISRVDKRAWSNYATERWGKGWSTNPESIEAASIALVDGDYPQDLIGGGNGKVF